VDYSGGMRLASDADGLDNCLTSSPASMPILSATTRVAPLANLPQFTARGVTRGVSSVSLVHCRARVSPVPSGFQPIQRTIQSVTVKRTDYLSVLEPARDPRVLSVPPNEFSRRENAFDFYQHPLRSARDQLRAHSPKNVIWLGINERSDDSCSIKIARIENRCMDPSRWRRQACRVNIGNCLGGEG